MKRAILIVLAVACTCSMPAARAATAADSELELDNQEACLYDRVKVAWKSRQLPASHNGAWLSLFAAPAAASHDGSSSNPCSALRPFAMLNLGKRSGGDNNSSTSSSGSSDQSLLLPPRRIECELDQRFCKVRFAAMEVNAVTAAAEETDVKYYDTTLRFTVGTNMPPVDTADLLAYNFDFTGEWGDIESGEWRDSKTLVVRHSSSGEGASVKLRWENEPAEEQAKEAGDNSTSGEPAPMVHGTVAFRVKEAGDVLVALCASQTASAGLRTLAVSLLHVTDCDSAPVLQPSSAEQVYIDPPPSFELPGTLALDRAVRHVLPKQVLPNQDEGSWSLSFWLWLWEHDNGVHALFHKGTGSQRTPSAWILPNSRRITIRASTNSSEDAGVDINSDTAMPERQWVHLTFTFANVTAIEERSRAEASASSSDDGIAVNRGMDSQAEAARAGVAASTDLTYRCSLYVNGKLDIELLFHHPVLPNDGPLSIGRGPWHPGIRGLVSRLRMYPVALAPGTIEAQYLGEKRHFDGNAAAAQLQARGDSSGVEEAEEAYLGVVAATKVADTWAQWRSEYEGSLEHRDLALARELTADARAILEDCNADPVAAMHLLYQAVQHGYADAMYEAAQVLLFPSRRLICEGHAGWQESDAGLVRDTVAARRLMEMAAALGHSGALRELAFLVTTGVGSGGVVDDDDDEAAGEAVAALPLSGVVRPPAHWGRASALLVTAGGEAEAANEGAMVATMGEVASSWSRQAAPSSPSGLLWGSSSLLGVGLYHLAAARSQYEAAAALSYRYRRGEGVLRSDEVATFYSWVASDEGYRQHNAPGNHPANEMNRLTEETEADISKGQLGEDDVLIQTVMMQAENGNVNSMLEIANTYYYGTHGMPRDQTASYNWFRRAADTGNSVGQFAVGNLLRKGEGVAENATEALAWFRLAAAQNHTRSLNGLGSAYFHGHGVPQNYTKAFEYFVRAAELGEDGDSFFNAGYMHQQGLGVPANASEARRMFEAAASRHAFFDAVKALGDAHFTADPSLATERSVALAAEYLGYTVKASNWGQIVREGFELYLHDDFDGATIKYLRGWELGYETAAANGAYLLHTQRAVHDNLVGYAPHSSSEALVNQFRGARHMYEHSLSAGGEDSALKLGDYYFYGKGGLEAQPHAAAAMYSRASATGSSQAAFNLALMNEFGIPHSPNPYRAERYYEKALDLAPDKARVPVYLALFRMRTRAWLRRVGAPEWVMALLRLRLDGGDSPTAKQEVVPQRVYDAALALDLDSRGDAAGRGNGADGERGEEEEEGVEEGVAEQEEDLTMQLASWLLAASEKWQGAGPAGLVLVVLLVVLVAVVVPACLCLCVVRKCRKRRAVVGAEAVRVPEVPAPVEPSEAPKPAVEEPSAAAVAAGVEEEGEGGREGELEGGPDDGAGAVDTTAAS